MKWAEKVVDWLRSGAILPFPLGWYSEKKDWLRSGSMIRLRYWWATSPGRFIVFTLAGILSSWIVGILFFSWAMKLRRSSQ